MIQQTIGFNWGAAGVGNAVWSGATLIDVLALAGITKLSDFPPGMHIRFASEPEHGGDALPNGVYGTSVPLSKVWLDVFKPSQNLCNNLK
jgi:nitrate reductase (NAD(P)H)